MDTKHHYPTTEVGYSAVSTFPEPHYPGQGEGMPPQYPQYPQNQPPGSAYYCSGPGVPGQPVYVAQPQYLVGQPQVAIAVIPAAPSQNFAGHMALACFAFLCCGGIFGGIAFILAVVAQSMSRSSPDSARGLGRASLGISIVGMVLVVILVVVYYAMQIYVTAQFLDVLARNDTLIDFSESLRKMAADMNEENCRELTSHNRVTVTDPSTLSMIEACRKHTFI